MTVVPVPGAQRSDRRVERSRRSLELFLDSLFRPNDWAAALAYHLGLQGTVRPSTTTIHVDRVATTDTRSPLRIAFASDFHAGPTTDPRLLAEACDTLASFKPDVLLLGGDFVSVRARYIERLAPLIAEIPAPYGKFGVLGNHDLRADRTLVIAELERAGVRILANESVALPAPFGDMCICGIEDATRGMPRPDLALGRADGVRIVLMHSPQGLESIGDRKFDVALCGHTHGGQIALPWGTPVLMPGGHLNRRYAAGRFDLDATSSRTLVVSRGVGCSTIPVRAFAAPEVHLCLII